FTSAGSGQTYGVLAVRSWWSFLARAISVSSVITSIAVPAMILAAWTMPLWAAPDFPWAVICQVWPGVPIATVATRAWTVGTAQLTSATSVEPIIGSPLAASGTVKSQRGV